MVHAPVDQIENFDEPPKICGGVPINPAYLYILGGYMIAAIGAIAYKIVAGNITG